jgi:SAM-dependent methyltransferase
MSDKIYKKIKKYWNKQPCNINHSKKKYLSKEYFDEVRKKKYFVEKHIFEFAKHENYKNKNILEIGCGIGTDAAEFIKHGANYIGIDFSEKSIEISKKRMDVLGLKKFKPKFFVDNCENPKNLFAHIKKSKIKFDLIYSFGVIHHTKNMKKAFDSIHKLSSKNTEIKIMLYAKNSYKNFLLDHTPYRFERQKGCPVVYKVDNNDLKKILSNKFKIIDQYQDFIFPYKINLYKKGIYEKLPHFQLMPLKIFNVLQKNIGEHLMLRMKKNKS